MYLENNGALDGLKVVDFSDLQRYKSAIAAGEQLGFGYYFPNLLIKNKKEESSILIHEDDGCMCAYRWRFKSGKPRLDIYAAPSPLNLNVLKRCFERTNDYNSNRSSRLLRVDEQDIPTIRNLSNIQIKHRKSQYLFSPKAFADLGGKKYRTVRRYVSKFRTMDSMRVEPYSDIYRQSCFELLKKWLQNNQKLHGSYGAAGSTRRLINFAGKLRKPDLFGEIILIDDKLVGFAFGGEIRPGIAAFMEAKADFDIRGLSYFQRYSFMNNLQNYAIVNDGSDAGRMGLAQLKNRFRPVSMHKEFRVSQSA